MLKGGFFEDGESEPPQRPVIPSSTTSQTGVALTFDEDKVTWDPTRQLFIIGVDPSSGASFSYDPWSAAHALSKAGDTIADKTKEAQELQRKLDKIAASAAKEGKQKSETRHNSGGHNGGQGGSLFGGGQVSSSGGDGDKPTPESGKSTQDTHSEAGETNDTGPEETSQRDFTRPEDTDDYTYSWSDSDGDWVPVHKGYF